MYAFSGSTVNRLQPVQTNSVTCGSKRFFISKKPELQLTVPFFCSSVQFSCGFFRLRELDFQTLVTCTFKLLTLESVVSDSTTIHDIEHELMWWCLFPFFCKDLLYISIGSHSHSIKSSDTIGDLSAGPLNHLQIRCRFLGGSGD